MTATTRRLSLVVLTALATAAAASGSASARTVWLCRPGVKPDPCTPGLSTTVYPPDLRHHGRVLHPRAQKRPKMDCFYVYPTASDQKTEHSNRHVDPEERSIALFQAARYSQYCRVFAPMYRQDTIPYLQRAGEPPASLRLPLSDVRKAFRDYLRRYSHGRGFVLLGHSQGSFLLRELIVRDIDPHPALRRRLVSAILPGGDVLVKRGSDVGGDFKHIPACHRATQLGCVIAYSTFDQPPPPDSFFGRSPNKREVVLCTNPARLSGSHGLLTPILPSKPFAPGTLIATGTLLLGVTQPMPRTVWSTEPGAYSARCSTAGGIDVMEVRARKGAPTLHPSPTPQWGLHLIDMNIALGNLIEIVRREGEAYALRR